MAITLQVQGDWVAQVQRTLQNALAVSMEVMGRTGEEACRHAIILMAQSARAMSKKAPKNRPVLQDKLGPYVENYRMGKTEPQKLYKWQFGMGGSKNKGGIDGTWENARKIGYAGLAKRSWMWGLGKLGASNAGRAIPGTSRVYSITGDKVNGYIKENRLSYITKAMPAGWEMIVQPKVVNKIFGQAKVKMARAWQSAINRRDKAIGKAVGSFFLRGIS